MLDILEFFYLSTEFVQKDFKPVILKRKENDKASIILNPKTTRNGGNRRSPDWKNQDEIIIL